MSNRPAVDHPLILVTGGTGQIGLELVRELAPFGTVVAPLRSELDLTQPRSIRATVRRLRPALIVNAGAYTAVDRAESERALCFAVNADGPAVLAEEARRSGAALVHYSTDYVFDGTKTTPYVETDEPAPLNVYGESKLAGERAIREVGGAWLVLRTSWVYGLRGSNFLRTILRLARERDELRVVDDQFGAPTWSRSVAAGTAQLLTRRGDDESLCEAITAGSGVYHISSRGSVSWCAFAQAILALDPRRDEHLAAHVVAISGAAHRATAQRPRWSVLSNAKIRERFGVELAPWEQDLERVLAERGAVAAAR